MPRTKKPSVDFYFSDWAEGTKHLTREEKGDYITLLCAIWDTLDGGIPNDPEWLRVQLQCRRVDARKRVDRLIELRKLYIGRDGKVHNYRTDLDRRKIAEDADTSSAPTSAQVDAKLTPSSAQLALNLAANAANKSAKTNGAGTTHARVSDSLLPYSSSDEDDSRPHGRVDPASVRTAVDRYHEIAEQFGLPKAVLPLTDKRFRRLRAVLEKYGIDKWQAALDAVERSDFLRGLNDRGWKANLDFLLRPDSFSKLLEGAYDNRVRSSARGPPEEAATTAASPFSDEGMLAALAELEAKKRA